MLPLGADTPRDPEPPAADEPPPRRLLYPEERTPSESMPDVQWTPPERPRPDDPDELTEPVEPLSPVEPTPPVEPVETPDVVSTSSTNGLHWWLSLSKPHLTILPIKKKSCS